MAKITSLEETKRQNRQGVLESYAKTRGYKKFSLVGLWNYQKMNERAKHPEKLKVCEIEALRMTDAEILALVRGSSVPLGVSL